MRTTEIRKNALRLAHELYESCAGELKFSTFNVDEEAKKIGVTGEPEAEAIFSYLISTGVMESPHIDAGRDVRFTDGGISVIEHSIDRPNDPSGPFPPLSVIVGDIGPGAQVAIGAGHFAQTRQDDVGKAQALQELLPLLQAASAELRASGREREATLLSTAEDEAEGEDSDPGFLKAVLGRFAKAVGNSVIDSATQALLTYCRMYGLLP